MIPKTRMEYDKSMLVFRNCRLSFFAKSLDSNHGLLSDTMLSTHLHSLENPIKTLRDIPPFGF